MAAPATTTFRVTGMTCASCVRHVERALAGVPGAGQVTVNLADNTAQVCWLTPPGPENLQAVSAAVEDAGYHAHPMAAGGEHDHGGEPADEAAGWRWRFLLGAVLTLPIMLAMFGVLRLPMTAMALAATVVQVVVGWPFYVATWKAARHLRATMDTLVVLGSTAAYAFSIAAWIRGLGDHHAVHAEYFDSSATIVTLVALGKWLESRARAKAGDAVRSLLSLAPKTAAVVGEGGQETVTLLDAVPVGAVVRIRPGERIPLDGVVLEGRSSVDASMVTGESVPVDRGPGDEVIGGTLNGTGMLVVRVAHRGADGLLAQVVQIVRQAQSSKASAQRLADRIAAVFVPIVMVLAAATFLFWWLLHPDGEAALATALTHAVAVLIIACPCALGLATPAALMVGVGTAARHGLLIRDAPALERSAGITAAVLDKTGTLTDGRLGVQRVQAVGGSEDEVLSAAAAVEQFSEHPIARAVLAEARRRGVTVPAPGAVQDFVAHAGAGVSATVDGVATVVGTPDLLAERGVAGADGADDGLTVLHVARGGRVLGWVGLADRVRPESAQLVRDLEADGVAVYLATGDGPGPARAVAAAVGLPAERVLARQTPAGKADLVRRLQAEGRRVLMVGDGINDAPPLAAADLGVAMGGGTDVAGQTAQIILLRDNPLDVRKALRLARATLARIRQNLVLAFLYNVLAIPLAMAGLLSPAIAAGAMALSSVSVVTNALRLRRVQV